MLIPLFQRPPTLARRLTLSVGLAVLGLASVGCAQQRPPRVTLAPTYSYVHDADALAEVERWPEVPTAVGGRVAIVEQE